VLIVTRRIGAPPTAAACAGGGCCFALRVVATAWHWNLPKIAG